MKIRRARPWPRYGASTMKQLIAHASGSGSSEKVSAILGRSSRGPACTQPTGAPSTYAR